MVTDTAECLQVAVDKWNRGMTLNGIKINTASIKIEFITDSRGKEVYEIRMEGEVIQHVRDCKSIGITINQWILQENGIAKYMSKL